MLCYRYSKQTFSKLFGSTHLRSTPWLIGIIGGYFLLKTRNKNVTISKVQNDEMQKKKNNFTKISLYDRCSTYLRGHCH